MVAVGDIGHVVQYSVQEDGLPFDLSAGGPFGAPLTVQFRFQTQAGVVFTRTPTISDAAGGVLRWTNDSASDFATSGTYGLAVRITFSGGETFTWPTATFTVSPVF